MNRSTSLAVAIAIAALSLPAAAQPLPSEQEQAPTLTTEQVRLACARNRADTLPNPFSDVPRDHWAYSAVLNLFYCGPAAGRPLDTIPAPTQPEG